MLMQVMLFQPIALDEQAKDLLKAGQYEQALNLAGICAADGAPWAETAFAETALLLLHGQLPLAPGINQNHLKSSKLFLTHHITHWPVDHSKVYHPMTLVLPPRLPTCLNQH